MLPNSFQSALFRILAVCLFASGSFVHAQKAGEEKSKPAQKAPAKEEKKSESVKKEPAKEKASEEKKAPAAEKTPAKEAKAEETLHKVTAGEFSVKTKISGIVESAKQTPISAHLERWSDLTVIEVVPHGTVVKKGDLLIDLDSEKLEEKIKQLKAAMPLQELELATAIKELEKLEKTTPISLANVRKSKQHAEEDLAYFEDVSRPMREKDAKKDVSSAENYLAYATEELNQLKKMYERDDLTEETEEIILQRAQNSVDEYTWMLEQTKERVRRVLTTSIPREHESLKSALELQRINWRAGERSLREGLQKAKLELAAKQRAHDEAIRSLGEHEADLENLDLRAPQDGIVYYGMSQKGKWTTAATVERKLIPGGKLTMNEIVMTLVDPNQPQLRCLVPEDKVSGLETGQSAEASFKILPDEKVGGKVTSVSRVPYADGTFDTVISLSKGKESIVPGIKGEAEIVLYKKAKAITVPKKAVKKEGDREMVTLKGGKTRVVKTGKTSGDKIEILEGLKAGDEIVLPKAPAKAPESQEKEGDEQEEKKSGEKK
ncbi:MAG: biotin/lipoyl-binding protein [Verrucomicrobiales bacterium]|nr:biotin/lipoyl-binding protein [Verrucomicrobiales bacterium]